MSRQSGNTQQTEELLFHDRVLFDYTKDLDIVGEPFSPSNEVLDLISKASLLNVRKEFTGCLPSSSLHQITNIMKHFDELDKVIELNEEEEAIISDYNEHSQIPSLKELLSRTSCATAPGTPTLSREQNVDEYGFIVDTSNPLTPLETIQSKSRIQKWEQLISQWDSYSTDKKRKHKQRARKGIPNALRGEVWTEFAEIKEIREEMLGRYTKLLELESPFEAQIHLDLSRSLPKHVLFTESGGAGQKALYNVLKAYSIYDPNVGYCQGMGFLCAVFLIYLSEEDVFVMMRRLIQTYRMSGLFEPGFPTLFECLFIHSKLLQLWLPRLSSHLEKLEIEPSMYSFGWYTTLFANSLDFPFIIRIMDMFLAEGMNVVFRVSIAILKLMQKELLKYQFDDVVLRLKNLNKYLTVSPDELIACAAEFTLSDKRMDKLSREYETNKL